MASPSVPGSRRSARSASAAHRTRGSSSGSMVRSRSHAAASGTSSRGMASRSTEATASRMISSFERSFEMRRSSRPTCRRSSWTVALSTGRDFASLSARRALEDRPATAALQVTDERPKVADRVLQLRDEGAVEHLPRGPRLTGLSQLVPPATLGLEPSPRLEGAGLARRPARRQSRSRRLGHRVGQGLPAGHAQKPSTNLGARLGRFPETAPVLRRDDRRQGGVAGELEAPEDVAEERLGLAAVLGPVPP